MREWGFALWTGVACVTLGAACQKHEKPSLPGSGSAGEPSEPGAGDFFALTPRKLIAVDDPDDLMGMIVALRDQDDLDLRCSATPIAADVVLTAAHCIAARRPVEIADHGPIVVEDEARACVADACSDKPVQPGSDVLEFAKNDLATAVVDVAPPMRVPEARLAALPGFGRMPDLYLVSKLYPTPMLVCSAEIVVGVGIAEGAVTEGDSGSPLVVLEPTDAGYQRTIVGVVSARAKDATAWYFAPLPFDLPWPTRARAEARPLVEVRYELESRHPRCAESH